MFRIHLLCSKLISSVLRTRPHQFGILNSSSGKQFDFSHRFRDLKHGQDLRLGLGSVPLSKRSGRSPRQMSIERGSGRGIAAELWEMNQLEAYRALYHPFVVAIADGSLESDSFRDFIAQDVFYLKAFSEAYGLAFNHTEDARAKSTLRGLQSHVEQELEQVHFSAMQNFGLRLPEEITPNGATTAYTDFLLAVARGESEDLRMDDMPDERVERGEKLAAFTVGALTPCMRLYAFLGQQIRQSLPEQDEQINPYLRWIQTYGSADFEAAATDSEVLLNQLASSVARAPELEILRKLYRRSMNLEVDFFAAQPSPQNSFLPLLSSPVAMNSHFIIVSDFDLTCTLEDSCSILKRLSLSGVERSKAVQLENEWGELVRLYTSEHQELLDGLVPQIQMDKSDIAFNPQALNQVMQELSKFERKANDRVEQARVLEGLSEEGITQAGDWVAFHPGCEALLKSMNQREKFNWEFHVLSVCWSQSLIRGAFACKGLQFANLHANELCFRGGRGLSDGSIDRRIETAVDKEREFTEIIARAKHKSSKQVTSIYIGDSATDLFCLLMADVGVVVGQSSTLNRLASSFGIRILPLYAAMRGRQSSWKKTDGDIYSVSSWAELDAFLIGQVCGCIL